MEPNAGNRLKFVEENIRKIKPLAYNIFGGILLVSDYDFLKQIFSQRSGSHRLSIHKIKLDEELREQDQGSTDRLEPAGFGPWIPEQDYGMFEKTNEVRKRLNRC